MLLQHDLNTFINKHSVSMFIEHFNATLARFKRYIFRAFKVKPPSISMLLQHDLNIIAEQRAQYALCNFNATLARFKLSRYHLPPLLEKDFNATLARFKRGTAFRNYPKSNDFYFNATLARFKLPFPSRAVSFVREFQCYFSTI